jgi:hypothetical protein
MKRFTFFVCLVVLLLLIPAGVSAKGNLFISSTPSGAAIYFDDTYIGPTPSNQSYNAGLHTVMVRAPGYSDYTINVTVVNNSTVVVDHVFQNSAPALSGISPNNGFNTSTLSPVTISGSGFSTSGSSVVLTKTGETNITATITSREPTQIICELPLIGKPTGTWNVFVINADGQSTTQNIIFAVNSQANTPTLTSITPASGQANTTVSISSIVGTNFASAAKIRLRRSSYNDIAGTVSSVNAAGTVIAGTFNLNNQAPGGYQVCVYNDDTINICGLSFTIYSDVTGINGSIDIKSSPAGGRVFFKNEYKGYSPIVLYNITPGIYTVSILRTGYSDYTESVKVTAANVSYVNAYLALLPETTTVVTTTPTPFKTAVTTIKKSTLKVPTTWPSATTAEGAPVDPVVIVGAVGIGIGLVMIRRR